MKKIFNFFVPQLLLLMLASCAASSVYQSRYQPEGFNLKEQNTQWDGNYLSDEKTGLVSGITNDEKYAYVKLKVVDKEYQRRVLMNGLILWIDPDNKAKKNIGIEFPTGDPKEHERFNLNQIQAADPHLKMQIQNLQMDAKSINKKFQEQTWKVNLLKSGELIKTLPDNRNQEGLNIMLYMDDYQIMYYEARIPLEMIFEKPVSSPVANLPAFSYGFEIKKIEAKKSKYGDEESSYYMNPSQMNSYNRPYGGYGAYGNYYRMGGNFSTKTEMWVKGIKLSAKQ